MTIISIHQQHEDDRLAVTYRNWGDHETYRITVGQTEVDIYIEANRSEDFRVALAELLDRANNAIVEVR